MLIHPGWQTKIARRLSRAARTVQVQIARDMIARVRELDPHDHRALRAARRTRQTGRAAAASREGCGRIDRGEAEIGEIAGIDRFTSDAQLARISGCAPIQVSSGRTDRHRLGPGGNRQLNHAFHMLAYAKILHDPQTAVYLAKQTPQRQDQTRSDPQPQTPPRPPRLPPTARPSSVPITVCLT